MQITHFEDINMVLHSLNKGLKHILGSNFIGLYLTGSLSYHAFNPDRSDIDLLVILNEPLSPEEMDKVEQLHITIESENQRWARRIECSYIPKDMLLNILPPKTPRPYIGEGKFYREAVYGNEWIINLYWLYHHGIAIFGPEFKTFIKSVNIIDVQKACIKDLYKEWKPKIDDPDHLNNSHYQSYIVLNLCRILYTVLCSKVASKEISALWVKQNYPEWKNLIEGAEAWGYGKKMNMRDEATAFIQFAIDKVNEKVQTFGILKV